MILPIYTYGQPVLRKVAQDIDKNYPDLNTLIENMWETLAESDGIGLAAPQIGLAIRLVVIDLRDLKEDFPEYADFKNVYINPHIIEYDDTSTDTSEEGCLSLPAIHEKVIRPVSCSMSLIILTEKCLLTVSLHSENSSSSLNCAHSCKVNSVAHTRLRFQDKQGNVPRKSQSQNTLPTIGGCRLFPPCRFI